MPQSAIYSEREATKANLTLKLLGLKSWEPAPVKALQAKVKAKADGWFGGKSIKAWKRWAKKHQPKPVPTDLISYEPGQAIIGGESFPAPIGLGYLNHIEEGGLPAQLDDTSARKHEVTQFVLHRGAASSYKPGRNFAALTERILDARGLSGSHSMDIDGTIYQHFDPAIRRGRHATHHNVQSDSLDIGGPFSLRRKPAPGQEKLLLKVAIGRKNDGKPPLTRKPGHVRCWTMPEAQIEALALFLPWWCELRGIELTACEDWRTFRLGGVGRRDPVTKVKGILAHTQISGPGRRVDGILPLHHMKERGIDLGWRAGEDFFNA